MSRAPTRRNTPLTVDAIVQAATTIVHESGLGALSMRRLGTVLEVDPMAVYHHVGSKRGLLRLVTERVLAEMPVPDPTLPWDARVVAWATAYWEVVVANRDLTLAGLADPQIAEGGMPVVRPLAEALSASGIADDLVEPSAWLVIDFVHGSALGASAPLRHATDELGPLRAAFASGLDTILAGVAARSAPRVRRAGR